MDDVGEILCKKGSRGRGFKDLHLFNIAMLGKMAWRLVTDSSALVCQLLKARYFPHGDFLSATLGSRPSYTWTSIMAAQDLVRRGVRWKIGNENGILVLSFLWIDDVQSLYLHGMAASPLNLMRVLDFFKLGTRQLDVDFLHANLNPIDVGRVLRTVVAHGGGRDKLI
ncbi:hypothetical protein ACS0TY_030936 [Phlomoides rotata]